KAERFAPGGFAPGRFAPGRSVLRSPAPLRANPFASGGKVSARLPPGLAKAACGCAGAASGRDCPGEAGPAAVCPFVGAAGSPEGALISCASAVLGGL